MLHREIIFENMFDIAKRTQFFTTYLKIITLKIVVALIYLNIFVLGLQGGTCYITNDVSNNILKVYTIFT